jgi:oligopeptide/dipeptide ABC transporter ATP-binding protein
LLLIRKNERNGLPQLQRLRKEPEMSEHLLEVDNLEVGFFTRQGVVQAVRGVSFHIDRGETLGLVGESGSGKSVTAQALMGLIELPGRITGGDVRWKGESLVRGPKAADVEKRVKGREISIVFQDPMTSLNPVFKVGRQIAEVLRRHRGFSKHDAHTRAVELLDLVGFSFPKRRVEQYPHELSGGMRQRVMIAMGLACEPELLIADEPTTALDVTIQAQILDLIADLQKRLQVAVLIITHDLGVVAGLCDRVAVMYGGKLVETGPATDIFARPGHPYSRGLLRSTPRLDVVLPRLVSIDGAPPNLMSPPPGCPFEERCPLAIAACREAMPLMAEHPGDRHVACLRAFEVETVPAPKVEVRA